jgi:DNA-binding CsgD family transcriptional regulator
VVGRSNELRQLAAAVVARRGAVITGPAGVGKTTLAVTGVELAQQRGMSMARATATRASRGLPFGALASMLPADPDGDRLSREDRGDLLRRYGRAVVDGAGGRPLLVFVDDAHLLDDGSATLLHQLALTRAATVLATVRSGERAPDPVVALWKDALADRIEVGVLDAGAIEELLVSVLGGPVDAASVRQLVDRCRGNPLFLRELVTGALEAGALVEEGGLWRLRGDLRPTARLVELVALRLGDLTAAERAVLELLTLGEPLEQAELARLADPVSVDALEQKGLITSRPEGRRAQVWLAHPVYGDVVRVGISAIRGQRIARSLAEVIEAGGGPGRGDTLRLASLRLMGGGGSAELLLAGAVAARARHDHALAERLARAAIEEGAGFAARYVAAEAAQYQGRPEQAENELAALATDAVSDAERARVAVLRFDNAFFLRGRADLRLLDDVAEGITDPLWRDELVSRRVLLTGWNRGPRAAVEAASTLLERPGTGARTAAHVVVVFYNLVRLGRLDQATELLSPSAGSAAIPAVDEPWDQWALFGHRAGALIHAGRLREAEELLTGAYDLVLDQPTSQARAFVARWLAVLHLEQGRPMSAFRRASESYTLFRQLGQPYPARWPYGFAALALALVGQADQAAETLAVHDALDPPSVLPNETDILQARAWTAAAAGDLPAARDHLEAAAELGEQIGDLIGASGALHGLARLGRAGQVAARLTDLVDDIDGDLAAARAAYANAVAAADSVALDQVASEFENQGANLYAAEACAEAAVLLRRAGMIRQTAAAEQKAARLLARCEGAATPPIQTMTGRLRLTPAELDTAVQAAAGRTNKQIAGDMHLSVRTVESHLQRAYEKLGVSGRHALAEALRNQPTA